MLPMESGGDYSQKPFAGATRWSADTAELARHPIMTYVFGFTAVHVLMGHLSRKDCLRKLCSPLPMLTIKTYVRLGLGVGIVADMAHDPQTDGDLVTGEQVLFCQVTSIAFRRGTFLRGFMYRFVNLFAPIYRES